MLANIHFTYSHRMDRVIRLRSFTGADWRNISLEDRTCDCVDFASTQRCPHLAALGIHPLRPFTAKTHPTFSQALSGLVKSLRIRRVEDAVYWLLYLDTFKERQHRYRVARRLLIGAAEDGHSIDVMENVLAAFPKMAKPQTELHELAAEVVRICKVPNWWNPVTGGPDYIHSGLVGERGLLYFAGERSPATMGELIESGMADQCPPTALAGVMGLFPAKMSATRQAELVLALAKRDRHPLAERLAGIHLRAKSALSGDNNFLCQAVWMLAGGASPVALISEPVPDSEVTALLTQASERWKNPAPIPGWCCDGVHSAGNDIRFMGMWRHMFAVCRAFAHYGRIDPADKWLPEFRCLDGLVIEDEPGIHQTTHSDSISDQA